MGRAPCCDKANVKKGPWSPEEDAKLKSYIEQHGTGGNWIALPQKIGLKRCGKSCRLRWLNYLRPNIKHGGFSEEEDHIICSLYISIGSRWSIIAAQLPGRTDNDIKNYWNTRLKKKLLGKQRKEQLAARRASLKQQDQIIKREIGESFAMNQLQAAPYWPELPAVMTNNNYPVITQDSPTSDHINFLDQESIKSLLIKLGGRFSDNNNFQESIITNTTPTTTTNYAPQDQVFGHINFNYGSSNLFQGIDDSFAVELDDHVLLSANSQQKIDGLENFVYGNMDQQLMTNCSSSSNGVSSSPVESSSNWENNIISSLQNYPDQLLVSSDYENCQLLQDSRCTTGHNMDRCCTQRGGVNEICRVNYQ